MRFSNDNSPESTPRPDGNALGCIELDRDFSREDDQNWNRIASDNSDAIEQIVTKKSLGSRSEAHRPTKCP